MSNEEELVTKAKLAEMAERYDDMATHMAAYVKQVNGEINEEGRNLLSVAFKNKIGARRSAWRVLNSEETQHKEGSSSLAVVKEYKEEVKGELIEIHSEVLGLLDDHLLPACDKASSGDKDSGSEMKLFYLKMKGDYCRYKAEYTQGDDRKEISKLSEEAYKQASEVSKELSASNPVRLGLALNFSVFYYEIIGDNAKACSLAKEAFDEAIAELDTIQDEKSYKDTTLIMQLLRDNLTLWSKDDEGAQEPEAED